MVKDGVYEVKYAEEIANTHVHLLSFEEIQKILSAEGFASVKVFKKRKSHWNVILAQK
jgi:hypothetical protein